MILVKYFCVFAGQNRRAAGQRLQRTETWLPEVCLQEDRRKVRGETDRCHSKTGVSAGHMC